MARIDLDDLLKAAERHAKSAAAQRRQTGLGMAAVELEAEMLNKRRNFLSYSEGSFFESILEGSDLFPMRYFGIGQIAGRAVGRIQVSLEDERSTGFATGFLVAPNILLTNQHVLRSARWAEAATFTLDAEDRIDGLPMVPRIFQLRPEACFIADDKLDFCFAGVSPAAVDGTPLSQYGYFRLFAETGKIVRDEYATIIQHPNGRQKHIAARNNRISVYVYDDPAHPMPAGSNDFLYYSTDTLHGSSGAPVLSDQWYAVALHRQGVPAVRQRGGKSLVVRRNGRIAAQDDPEEVIKFVSNEGVRISRILARLADIARDGTDSRSATAAVALAAVTAAAGKPSDGPLSTPTTRYAALQERAARRTARFPSLEIVKRKPALFPEKTGYGYNPKFLDGFTLPLPKPGASLRQKLAPRLDRPDSYLLPFRHFTTAMHAQRRMAVFAAVNISGLGKPSGSMGKRPGWSYDPRIDLQHQPDDSIFSTKLQRGHLAARDYVFWGGDEAEIKEADTHSFTLTNACPQIARFNGNQEWYEIERQVAAGVQEEDINLTEFVGPVFSEDDPRFDDVRGPGSDAVFDTGLTIPLRFWKIVIWAEDGALKHRALLLDQSEELNAAGPLEFDIEVPGGVEETTVEHIAELTGLAFPVLDE